MRKGQSRAGPRPTVIGAGSVAYADDSGAGTPESAALRLQAANLNTLVGLFPSQSSLGENIGDTLSVSFKVRQEANVTGYFRFGLFHIGPLGGTGDDSGYYVDYGKGGSGAAWYAPGAPADLDLSEQGGFADARLRPIARRALFFGARRRNLAVHSPPMSFSPDELLRYQRHLGLAGFGPDAQEKLRSGSVLVIGAGGLGCPALLYLAAAGVGRIVLLDPDVVDVSNLQRQILYTTAEAGQPKAATAAARLRALNPHISIEARSIRFTRANALDLVRSVDLVLDGSDNFATRYLVNDACVLADRPFVYGAIQGFEGQVSVFNYRGGPTYRCLFPEPPEPGAAPNCAEAGVLGVLPGLVGALQATEAIKLLAGIGEPLSGRLFLYDALAMTTRTLRLAADPRSRAITELPADDYGVTCRVPTASDFSASSPCLSVPSVVNPSEIAPSELRAALASSAPPQLLDVREDWERALGALSPSSHIPLASLPTADLASLDPSRPLVVYCAGGVRSTKALPVLRSRANFTDLRSLRGGFKAWVTTAPASA